MGVIVGIWVGLLLAISGGTFFLLKLQSQGGGANSPVFKEELAKRTQLANDGESIIAKMVDIRLVKNKGQELLLLREALKTERGRITITQAELETVETRLRELEEIERELEASAVDTKEEVNILKKKEKELADKNSKLKDELSSSNQKVEAIIDELEMSAEMQEQIQNMRTEMLQTAEKVDLILLQLEECNFLYMTMKRRYDALDIEYAQLYEKFASAEQS